MSTIADLIRKQPDPYESSIACFAYRAKDTEARTVTFHFADQSSLTFRISYALEEADAR